MRRFCRAYAVALVLPVLVVGHDYDLSALEGGNAGFYGVKYHFSKQFMPATSIADGTHGIHNPVPNGNTYCAIRQDTGTTVFAGEGNEAPMIPPWRPASVNVS